MDQWVGRTRWCFRPLLVCTNDAELIAALAQKMLGVNVLGRYNYEIDLGKFNGKKHNFSFQNFTALFPFNKGKSIFLIIQNSRCIFKTRVTSY